jgi:hypothetical protein
MRKHERLTGDDLISLYGLDLLRPGVGTWPQGPTAHRVRLQVRNAGASGPGFAIHSAFLFLTRTRGGWQ